jgi:rhamnogalacturonyl hydrolase YesR
MQFRLAMAITIVISVTTICHGQPAADSFRFPEGTKTITTACGVTRRNTPVSIALPSALLTLESRRTRVLLVVHASADSPIVKQVVKQWAAFRSQSPDDALQLGLVPSLYPDGLPAESVEYPPQGTAYSDRKAPESVAIWRYIGNLAPDLVVTIRGGAKTSWELDPVSNAPKSLAGALNSDVVAGVGTVSAVALVAAPDCDIVQELKAALEMATAEKAGTAKRELRRRQSRSPLEVATELSGEYGHKLPSVAYIPSLALIGRMRLGELTDDSSHLRDVQKMVAPYMNGKRSSLGDKPSGSTLSGHLVFGELADRTDDERYIRLVTAAADLGFDKDGREKPSMPFHHEMSDAVFMGTPILVQAGRLTSEQRYAEMAKTHLQFMLDLNLRDDGLHQHSPLDPARTAWGRGNGFPALGLALSLSDLPADAPQREMMLAAYRSHLAAMLKHQDEMGMWHQVVDSPESYREFTVTCMTTFAIVRGLREGWLDKKTYEPAAQQAWQAIKRRVGPDGQLSDVCQGTGKQKSYRDYLDRKAILGKDDRGGAMALMVSTEIAFAQVERVFGK